MFYRGAAGSGGGKKVDVNWNVSVILAHNALGSCAILDVFTATGFLFLLPRNHNLIYEGALLNLKAPLNFSTSLKKSTLNHPMHPQKRSSIG